MRNSLHTWIFAAVLAAAGLCRAASNDYLVVDLTAGVGATNYPVSYLSEAPAGGWTDAYKTNLLVLRRIPRGPFMMGSPTNDINRGSNEQAAHPVTLSNDFYIGVFEMTEGQYARVLNGTPNSMVAKWFADGFVDGINNFKDGLNSRTAGLGFDLPTEAQWEFACRAGSVTAYHYGDEADRLTNFAWTFANAGGSVHAVGQKQPNAWGLYDMHGNADEAAIGAESDPIILRGGKYSLDASGCRSASRASTATDNGGFRLCLTVPLELFTLTVTNGTGSGSSYTNGQEVAISANAPGVNEVFVCWTGDTQTVANVEATNTIIRMPGRDATVTATYKEAPYMLTVVNGGWSGLHAQGELVHIEADAPPAMKMFDHWEVVPNGVDLGTRFQAQSASTWLTMPPTHTILTAVYADIPTYTLTVVDGLWGSGSYTNGERVSIAAAAPTQHNTFRWTGYVATVENVTNWVTTLVMPPGNVTITATYPPIPYLLTVKGGLGGGSYTNGQTVTVIATNSPSALHAFDVWTGDTNSVADVFAPTTTVTLAGAATLTPSYRPIPMPDNTYMVVDLAAAQTSAAVSYLDAVPEEGWTDEYKTGKMVFRKVTAGAFLMGSAPGETDWRDETPHPVTMNKAFYLGLFEVTQAQWQQVYGNWPSAYSNADDRATHPVERVSYATVRGTVNGAKWPTGALVDSSSFMGQFRSKTGVSNADLPTEAQWEFACRAGTTGAYAGVLDDMAVYAANSGNQTAAVGQKEPNAWGLYDMHGNVFELCLDWYAGSLGSGAQTDPVGAVMGLGGQLIRIMRGGGYSSPDTYCRSGARASILVTNSLPTAGLRIAQTVGLAYPLTVIGGTVNTGGMFFAGTKIPISAASHGEEIAFVKWVVLPAASKLGALFQTNRADTVVTMPTNGVVLTATYAISPNFTALSVTGGTGGGNYRNGQTVTVRADAAPAWYVFDRWTGSTGAVANVTGATTTVFMAGGEVRLTATFRPRDDLPGDVNWLRVSGNGVTNSALTQAGTRVPVTAPVAPAGKVFGWWRVSPAEADLGAEFEVGAAATELVMPLGEVLLAAVYVPNPGTSAGFADVRLVDSRTGAALPGALWSPDRVNWYESSLCPLKPGTYSLTFKTPGLNWLLPAAQSVVVKKDQTSVVTRVFTWVPVVSCELVKGAASDAVTLTPANGQVLPGKKVALTARPASTSVFVQWENGSGLAARIVAPPTNATYTATFRLKASYTNQPVLTAAEFGARAGVAFSNVVAVNEWPATFVATGLPPGLKLNAATGVIYGVPTKAGSYPVQVKATNPNRLVSVPVTVQITVVPLAEPVLTEAAFGATVGVAFSNVVAVNEWPATFVATGLPPGLKLNAATGVIYGVPTKAGSYPVQVKATIPNLLLVSAPVTVQITVAPLAEKAQGTFTGCASVAAGTDSQQVKGLFTMTVSALGAISARETAQAATYSFTAKSWTDVTPEGVYRALLRTVKGETLEVFADAATGRLEGTLAGGGVGLPGWEIAAQRNAFLLKTASDYVAATNALAGFKGYYTVSLPVSDCEAGAAGNLQSGSGYVTVTVKDLGAVTMTGKLADGTAFSASSTLLLAAGDSAFVPLFVPLYGARGVFSGLLRIQAGGAGVDDNRIEADEDAPFLWVYPGKSVTTAEDRFAAEVSVVGAYYDTLAKVQAHYTGTDFMAEAQTWEVPLAFSAAGVASLAVSTNTNLARATLSAVQATGLFSGRFNLTLSAKVLTVSHFGVLTRDGDQSVGAGYYGVPQTVKVGTVSYAIKPSFTVAIE